MLKSYIRIALRNLRKQKLYAFINIFGLAVGIAFCALLSLYVKDELTYDTFHVNKDRIFRTVKLDYAPDGSVKGHGTSHPYLLGPALQETFPEVQRYIRTSSNQYIVRSGHVTAEEDVLFTDSTFFEVFTFPFSQGDPSTALASRNAAVLSPAIARKYFDSANPVGKTIDVWLEDNFETFTVTGIAKEIPSNSSIRFGLVLRIENQPQMLDWARDCATRWSCSWLSTYVELAPGASVKALEAKMPAFWQSHYPDETAQMREHGQWSGEGIPSTYTFQQITDMHLNPDIPGEVPTSDPLYSYILAAIGLGVLLIACINFTTLAIGRSAGRSKEVGVRKVVGANRMQLMAQFWGEAFMLSFLALILGIALAEAFLPVFNELTHRSLHFDYASSGVLAAALVGILLLTGLVAGSYPALVLSRFKPVEALKSRLRLSGSNVFTRSLVVLQFGLVVFLILGTFTMLRQLDYMRHKDLGFDREHVVVIPLNDVDGRTVLERFRNEVGNRTDVLGITGVNYSFNKGYASRGWVEEGVQHGAYIYDVTANYLDVLGMDVTAGRGFNPELASDSTESVVVNEAMVRDYGWTDPVGQRIDQLNATVIGVVQDFNFRSLHKTVEPAVLRLSNNIRFVLIRISPEHVPVTLDRLRATWKGLAPDLPFNYSFLDDDLNRFYDSEQNWSRIIGYSAFFAILIASLGMFGLAALSVVGRTKEIGIRKVLGASVQSLTLLLSRDFAWLVLIAVGLAAPAAYIAAHKWLQDFAYHIDLGPGVFLLAGGLALFIALATVSYQAIKAALADPVKSLRYE